MKHTVTLLAALLAGTACWGGPVDLERAARVAQGFWQGTLQAKAGPLADARTADWPYSGIYHFAHPDGGFVLVAADDCAKPILGYSATAPLDASRMPAHLRQWLDGYQQQLDWLREHGGHAYAHDSLAWTLLAQGLPTKDDYGDGVEPLLSTRWDQYAPYNDLCPAGTVTGCAATAQAQMMKYWNHPAFGTGSHHYTHYRYGVQQADFGHTLYDWDHMPDQPTSASSSRERLAVATLMRHCGVSLEMNYGTAAEGGSSAIGLVGHPGYASIDNSLQNHFGYSRQMQVIHKNEGYSNADWRAALIAELNLRHPIVYGGSSEQGGHGFVCDGYDSRGYMHFNFGWSGIGDGYYPVDSISPGVGGAGGNGTYTFNLHNSALLGAVPDHSLRVSDTAFHFAGDGGTDSLLFSSNASVGTAWSVESNAGWLTVDEPAFGHAGWVRFHVAALSDASVRSATITFSQGTEQVRVQVAQAGFSEEDMCPLTVVMESTRDGGWQGGAHLTIESPEGYLFGTAQLTDGQRDSVVVMVAGDAVRSVWHSGGGTDRYINYYIRNQQGETVVAAEYAYRTGGTHSIDNPCGHVGIQPPTSDLQPNTYPNPATGILNVEFSDLNFESGATLQLLDLEGRLLQEFKIQNPKSKIDLTSLPAGTYILRATTASGNHMRRIVKQ